MNIKAKTEIWKQASEVYAEISELSVKQALAHIYDIKTLTAEVRKAVITLINAGSQASNYFQDKITPQYNITIDSPQSFKVGQTLDEYELLEELGHGGMSQVFMAKRSHSERQTYVAIKIFAPRENSKELFSHFINEQKILSELSHPHIVKMLHGGMTDDQTAYLVMELIEQALPLDEYCKNRSQNNKIKLITQCADALAYSHANLIIHRDLKPDNILVNQKDELKIVDFGIAKLINNDLSGNKTTIMALTPSYAAPEQINSQQISVKTDVFSLAVVALDLLIKGTPLPKDRLIKSCVNDEQQIDKVLKSLNSDKDLKNILRKALEQSPDNRYSNMQSFVNDLNNWLEHKPVNATAQSILYRVKKFAFRRSALFATMVSFLAFLIIGSIVSYAQYINIKSEQQKSIEVKNFLLDIFSYADPEQKIGEKLSAVDLLIRAENEIKFKTFTDVLVKSEILSNIGIAFVNLNSFEKGERNLLDSLKLDPKNIAAQLKLIQLYLDISEPEKAEKYFSSLNLLIKENNNNYKNDKASLLLLSALKTVFHGESSRLKGIELITQARDLFIETQNFNSILSSTRVLTEFLFNYSNSKESVEISLATIELVKGNVSPINTELLRLRTTLAHFYNQTGDYQKAKEQIESVIQPLAENMGESHMSLIDALVQRSIVYRHLGEIDKSLADAERSYQISVSTYGNNSQAVIESLSVLLQLKFQIGSKIEAEKDLVNVVKMYKDIYGENYNSTINAEIELANFMAANGKLEEAISSIENTRQRVIKYLSPDNLNLIFSTNVLIKLLSKRDEVDQPSLQMAIENNKIAVKNLGYKHPQTAFSFFVMGNIFNTAQQFDKANDAYKSLLEKNMVAANNSRYVALTQSIALNYTKLNDYSQAIDFAKKSFDAAKSIYGETSKRTISSYLSLVEMLHKTQNSDYTEHLVKLTKLIEENNIHDKKTIDKLSSFK